MKKGLAIFLALMICISSVFVACSNNNGTETTDAKGNAIDNNTNNNKSTTAADGLEANADNYVLDSVEVTDKNGQTVTDKNGNPLTEDVVYKEVTKKNGDKVLVQVDDNGDEVKDDKGNVVTSKPNTTKADEKETEAPVVPDTPDYPTSNVKTEPAKQPTEANLTTIKPADDKVPTTSATGTAVSFSKEDSKIVASMLCVPYLYKNSYENAEGVPTEIAAHAAMWMASKENLHTSIFASGTIVLDLFKFFGQTVVNFKTKCNQENNGKYKIKYLSASDTFSIPSFDDETHAVDDLAFYSLGNNNYYKVTAKVKAKNGSDCTYKKVTAVIQRNKLDSELGFSIKALKWS